MQWRRNGNVFCSDNCRWFSVMWMPTLPSSYFFFLYESMKLCLIQLMLSSNDIQSCTLNVTNCFMNQWPPICQSFPHDKMLKNAVNRVPVFLVMKPKTPGQSSVMKGIRLFVIFRIFRALLWLAAIIFHAVSVLGNQSDQYSVPQNAFYWRYRKGDKKKRWRQHKQAFKEKYTQF